MTVLNLPVRAAGPGWVALLAGFDLDSDRVVLTTRDCGIMYRRSGHDKQVEKRSGRVRRVNAWFGAVRLKGAGGSS